MSKFAEGLVLAFDQTLGNTGVSVVKNSADGLEVVYTGIFKRTDPLKGFDRTIKRGLEFKKELYDWMLNFSYLPKLTAVVHEMPAVRGYRIESSLIASFIVHQVVDDLGLSIPLCSISNQHGKKVVGLKNTASKADVKFAVEKILNYDEGDIAKPVIWNQHVSDSVMLGLTYLYDQNEVVL